LDGSATSCSARQQRKQQKQQSQEKAAPALTRRQVDAGAAITTEERVEAIIGAMIAAEESVEGTLLAREVRLSNLYFR
jgi:hypothetical protein